MVNVPDLRRIYADQSVLVTGGMGFIGSNLAIRLVSLGARVTVLDSFMPETGANEFNVDPVQDRIKVLSGDVGDRTLLAKCLKGTKFVFNLAGTLSHTDSMRDPHRDLHSNCSGHISFLDACRELCPDTRILYAATRAQYGRAQTNPVNEDHPLVSSDANGINKTAGEAYHFLYQRHYGLKTTSLRLTNTYGPRHQMKHHRQGVLNWFVRRILDSNPIQVYGTGTQVRDMNYVDDVVDAMLWTLPSDAAIGETFNLGGSALALKDLAELLIRLNGGGKLEVIPYPIDSKNVEVGDYVADTTKIERLVGWKAQTSPDSGFLATLEFYRNHRARYW